LKGYKIVRAVFVNHGFALQKDSLFRKKGY
jgi:hypothetical protein